MNKILLLDRDGIINQDSLHYIKSVDEFIPIPGSIAAIARLTQAGYQIGIATNQSGIARGLYTAQLLTDIHDQLLQLVRAQGGDIHAIEYCAHLPDAGCLCRKPQPGMLYALSKRLGVKLNHSTPFVGDRVSDIQAALTAGIQPIMVVSPMTDQLALSAYPNVPIFSSLSDWVDAFLLES